MKTLLEKYATLIVEKGVNVQKDQRVVIRATVEAKELVREITKQAYLKGAKQVHVLWSDDFVNRDTYLYANVETLENVADWQIDQYRFFVNEGACFISVTSPMPGLNKDVDGAKMQRAGIALQKKLSFFQNFMMANHAQWVVVGAPNPIWAKQVFPKLSEEEAIQALWDHIYQSSRVTEKTDPIVEWNHHNQMLHQHNKVLNDYQFTHLSFKNSLGTDVVVGLVEGHIWAGGQDETSKGVTFNPNIPTEESFTMPHKFVTNGKVVATKPLNYQGKLIEDFYVVFKDGKVVEYDAKKEKEALGSLLNTDEGASYIGEIALISHDSPISNMNVLFYNTLYDENASCHMALGKAYPVNIVDGANLSLEVLKEKGYNDSMVHVDFMFGSQDMEIIGTTKDLKKVQIFKNGNFVI